MGRRLEKLQGPAPFSVHGWADAGRVPRAVSFRAGSNLGEGILKWEIQGAVTMAADKVSVRCCVAGGGPAGIMLGLLLARAGVEGLVLEKHADFFRDFRGDTIHPSTLEVMHELGLLGDLLKLPHPKGPRIKAQVAGLARTGSDLPPLQ